MPAFQPEKFCRGCQRTLPRDRFGSKGRNARTGTVYLRTFCLDCDPDHDPSRTTAVERTLKSREKHREKYNAYMRRFREEHPDQIRERKAAYHNLKVKRVGTYRDGKMTIEYVTRPYWDAVLNAFEHRCVYCRRAVKRLEADHLYPVAKGGKTEEGNLVPACRTCNASKGDQDPADFIGKERLDELLATLSRL